MKDQRVEMVMNNETIFFKQLMNKTIQWNNSKSLKIQLPRKVLVCFWLLWKLPLDFSTCKKEGIGVSII